MFTMPIATQILSKQRNASLDLRARNAIWKGGADAIRSPTLAATRASLFMERGNGCHLWDADENCFIDYLMGWGSVILGHCNELVQHAVARSLEQRVLLGMMTEAEVSLAERLVVQISANYQVRFTASGSEATNLAVRIARSVTGRETVLTCGYHGWLDWCQDEHPGGVQRAVLSGIVPIPYGDLGRIVEQLHLRRVAALVVEPVDGSSKEAAYLRAAAEQVHGAGALLILDEIKTGIRMGLRGAHFKFDFQPDMLVFSKALANGYPLAAVIGQRDLLGRAGDVWCSGTFHAWPGAIAAAHATLDILSKGDGLRWIEDRGRELRDGVNVILRRSGLQLELAGACQMPIIQGNVTDAVRICSGLIERGIFAHPLRPWFVSTAHTPEVIQQTLDSLADVCCSEEFKKGSSSVTAGT